MKEKSPHEAGSKVSKDNSTVAQRKRLLEALRNTSNGLTTSEIRYELDIMMPAARVHELRWRDGFNIITAHETTTGPTGRKHPGVARYVLFPGTWAGGAA